MTSLLTFNEDYDREKASDGISRYGAYLKDYRDHFEQGGRPTADPHWFALAALSVGSSPNMSPGYVRTHPRVGSLSWHVDGAGVGAVEVTLVAHQPPAVAALTAQWNGWRRMFNGRNITTGWIEPDNNREPSAFMTLTARFPVADMTLPSPAYTQTALGLVPRLAAAKASLHQLATQLNARAQPLLEALEA